MQFVVEENTPIKVSINQLYGIEINDFAVAVANTALLIAQNQMLKETETILRTDIGFLPLQTFENIHEGNALTMNWSEVLPADQCNYICGNPPFVGHQYRNSSQNKDMNVVFHDLKKYRKLDYVCAWYQKAAEYMKGTSIETAFVSTNSIVQGETVGILWKYLRDQGIKINFAYQSFIWTNESKNSANVHCVIIGFSYKDRYASKRIYSERDSKQAKNINGYLLDAPDIFIENRKTPISDSPLIRRGNDPVDGGFLLLSETEYEKYKSKEPSGTVFIHPFMMGREFINNINRYCFWLIDATPDQIKKCPLLLDRVKNVREYRLESSSKATRKAAREPHLFYRYNQPNNRFLVIPKVSSERRRYIPIGFLNPEVIAGDMLFIVENSNLYHFGVLTSNVHNAWMRTVAGRLKSDYRYSNTVVYNNFPWPEPTEKQKALIEKTAQNILDVRDKYPDSSLADLYDEALMPTDLRKAHETNDRAVMQAYGWEWRGMTEEDCVAELMKLYEQKTK